MDNILFDMFSKRISKNREKYYNDYLKIKEIVRNSSARYRGEPIAFPYQAFFYDKNDMSKLREFSANFIDVFYKVIKEYRTSPGFRKHFKFPEIMEELILIDPGYQIPFPISRFDIFYSFDRESEFKFCEINTDGTSAMNEARVIGEAMMESLIIKEIASDYDLETFELFYSWLETLLENYYEFLEFKGFTVNYAKKPVIAIVDFKNEGTMSEFKEFKESFIKYGYNTIICDPRELNYRDGQLYHHNLKIDLIYRRATTAKMLERVDEITDFLKAYRDRAVCVVGPFVSQLIHNKVLFAILHDRKKVPFLNESEHALIKKHVPFTISVSDGIPEDISKNRHNYLLKPVDSYAAKGVMVGSDYEEEEWDEIIEQIHKQNYLIQEYVDVPKKKMAGPSKENLIIEKYNYMTGLFLYNQQLKGIYARAGRKSIIGSAVESLTLPAYLLK
ncbi:MAG TPA: glutathionylspermidine synthase family protein [Halanaerobiales bacterium]|nr:glutathionylspermidine synthase family protein [Halanaerobiales bacterium]